MYSVNQDYLKLSEFLKINRKEEVVYPGLKPFNPTVQTDVKLEAEDEFAFRSTFQNVSVQEIMIPIGKLVPVVPFVPLNEENIVAILPLEDERTRSLTTVEEMNGFKSSLVSSELVNAIQAYTFPMTNVQRKPNLRHYITDQVTRKTVRDLKSRKQQGCGFCRRNGEQSSFFLAHSLKDADGNVTCPILREYRCPQCHATGDNAHTVAYCPLGWNVGPITSIKSTRRSCGCKWSDKHCHCV